MMRLLEFMLVSFAGASIFSFINLVAFRFPQGEDFIKKRSHCEKCGHELSFKDLVPVLGWIFLKGRCRYCHGKLSLRHPLAELSGGIAAVLCICRFGVSGRALAVYFFLALLTLIAFVDMDTMKIPNAFVLTMFVAALISIPLFPETEIWEKMIGIFVVSMPLSFINLLIPGGFGGGDIKLMAVSGLFLGWQKNLWAFAITILVGGSYCIYMLVTGKMGRKSKFPFGPFLCLGLAAAMFLA